MHLRAETLVRRHWNAIDQVARRLIRDKTLKEHEVLSILRWEVPLRALADVIASDKGLETLLYKAVAALGHIAETSPGLVQGEHALVAPPPREIADFFDALRQATGARGQSNGDEPTFASASSEGLDSWVRDQLGDFQR